MIGMAGLVWSTASTIMANYAIRAGKSCLCSENGLVKRGHSECQVVWCKVANFQSSYGNIYSFMYSLSYVLHISQ